MKRQIGAVTLELAEGNIAMLDVDAIVNAANEHLILGAGVAGAIREKGGDSIQEECYRIGHCPVGSAVITRGGNLNAKYVIHAVGPMYGEGDESTKLRSAVRSAIMLAEGKQLGSVALPAISTGFFHYPVDECAEIMISESASLAESNDLKHINSITLCLNSKKTYSVFEQALSKLP